MTQTTTLTEKVHRAMYGDKVISTSGREVNIEHVVRLLQKIASESGPKSGRYRLLMDAVAIIKTAKPNGAIFS